MNNYITLDDLDYKTKASDWTPVTVKPAMARTLLSSEVDVSYGPGVFKEYRGVIIAPVSDPGGTWGTIADLRTSLEKRQGLNFTDHYGNEGVAHVFGEIPEQSLSPMWDQGANEFYVSVRVILE